jgi:hypothetical protein
MRISHLAAPDMLKEICMLKLMYCELICSMHQKSAAVWKQHCGLKICISAVSCLVHSHQHNPMTLAMLKIPLLIFVSMCSAICSCRGHKTIKFLLVIFPTGYYDMGFQNSDIFATLWYKELHPKTWRSIFLVSLRNLEKRGRNITFHSFRKTSRTGRN